MRCKKHPVDISSSVGVCASCLRERLLSLLAAQAQAQAQNRAQPQPQQQPQPPPPVFPRSVSPYVSRRKSDDTETWHGSHHRRFHSTPQVGNTIGCFAPTTKKKHRKFSIFSYLFRSRSEKFDPDRSTVLSDPRTSVSPYRESARTSASSPYWSSILPARRRAPTRMSSIEDRSHPKPPPVSGRGMSPTQAPDSDPDCEDCSPSRSGYTSTWRSTPTPDIGKRTRQRGIGKNMSGLGFCLSPLVRPSPSRLWKQNGGPSKESVISGEVRGPPKPHISTAAGFCANRSRKMADFGRPNQNR